MLQELVAVELAEVVGRELLQNALAAKVWGGCQNDLPCSEFNCEYEALTAKGVQDMLSSTSHGNNSVIEGSTAEPSYCC